MSMRPRTILSIGCLSLILTGVFLFLHVGQSAQAQLPDFPIHLPIVLKQVPPQTPYLYSIDNSDLDINYDVSWTYTDSDTYILQEASKLDFSNARTVYHGSVIYWSPDPWQFPGTYYYRVAGLNPYGQSVWSNVRSVKIYPLSVSLNVRWDGDGYIRGSDYYNVGHHLTRECNSLTDQDTLLCSGHSWYEPNPSDFAEETWDAYYSPTTGEWKGGNGSDDPSWKWGYNWFLGYSTQLSNGKTITIDGQKFTATGPFNGTTTYGKAIKYWQLVNQSKFLYWDGGGAWTQYVHPGEAILRYDAGGSRLLIFSDIKRRKYYNGSLKSDNVQYIIQLSSSTSLPDSPPFDSLAFQEGNLPNDKPLSSPGGSGWNNNR